MTLTPLPIRNCTAVICARNESSTIAEIIKSAFQYCDEVIVVDGHSTDDTAQEARGHGAICILDAGGGKGDGIRAGLAIARGDTVVFLDADGSHKTEDIPKLVEPILNNSADLVVGSRMTGGSFELHGDWSGFVRMTGSHFSILLINWRWKTKLTDCNNGFRAIKKKAALSLKLTERIHTIEEEMVMKALQQGYRIAEVPTREYSRKSGVSSIRVSRVWPRFLWCLLKHCLTLNKPKVRMAQSAESLENDRSLAY